MIQRDYILRKIEEFRTLLAALAAMKDAQRWRPLGASLDEQFQKLVGADPAAAVTLTETELLAKLMEGDGIQFVREKTIFLIRLFKEAGDCAMAQEQSEAGQAYYLKGMHLLLGLASGNEALETPEFLPDIDVFRKVLYNTPLPSRTLLMLMQHYERTGAFARAEDALFALLDAEPGNEAVWGLGMAFYERMDHHSDADLLAGDLPREELKAGLAALQQRRPPPSC